MKTVRCASCDEERPHAGHGLCARCLRRRPDRPFVYAEGLRRRLADPPEFLEGFAAYVAERFSTSRATRLLAEAGRLFASHGNDPVLIVSACRSPTARGATLARVLVAFLSETGRMPHGLSGDEGRRAELRRARRLEATPAGFLPAVERFVAAELAGRERARRLRAPLPRHQLTEERLDAIVGLAIAVARRAGDGCGFEVVGETDVVAFLASFSPAITRRYLTHLRRFFSFTRAERLVLVDPTACLDRPKGRTGVASELLPIERQRALFQRWTDGTGSQPYESFVGLAGLLHGCSSGELANLFVEDCDLGRGTLRLGRRPRPVPLDPHTAAALGACLAYREGLGTLNPHVIVTRLTVTTDIPVSAGYLRSVLKPAAVTLRELRSTRLAALTRSADPRFVASSFGFTYRAPLHYLADGVDSARLAELAENL
ncbi:MAG: integrase [Acidimicrobiales bacterium]